MTSKTKESDYAWQRAKELCEEVKISGSDAKISTALLYKMHLDPKVVSRAEPPPGYEDRLVAALMAKAEASSFVIAAPKEDDEAVRPWFRIASRLIPVSVFSFVLVLGFALFQFFVKAPVPTQEGDLWAKAVENASEVEVSRWLASVSDGGSQLLTTSSDLAVLSGELTEIELERALKEEGGS